MRTHLKSLLAKAAVGVMAAACIAGAAIAAPADDPANWRKVDSENLLQITVNGGTILVEMRPDFAPGHVAQIKKIAKAGHYDGLPFFRVIDEFMAQGGDTYAKYQLYPKPYGDLKAEFTFKRKPATQPVQWLVNPDNGQTDWDRIGYYQGFLVAGKNDAVADLSADGAVQTFPIYCAGIAAMARADNPNSADTQYFLMRQNRAGPDALDASYTVWGRVLSGLDVVRGIKPGPKSSDGRMPDGDKATKVQIVADIKSAAKRPTVYVQRTDGPEFAKALAAGQGVNYSTACDLPPVPVVVEMPPSE
jgi:peptidylprolyl isomerase